LHERSAAYAAILDPAPKNRHDPALFNGWDSPGPGLKIGPMGAMFRLPRNRLAS
jgi:hypothetical protein